MKKPVALTPVEIEAMADYLANMQDLQAEDLKSDFRSTMQASFPHLQASLLDQIYADFMSVGSSERFSLRFDHKNFVRRAMKTHAH